MDVIHFTERATDPLTGFDATGARFLALIDGEGNSHISCVHLDSGASIQAPSITHAAVLLCVHGRFAVATEIPKARIDIYAGVGAVFDKGERYIIESPAGAIVLIIEADRLTAHASGISTPERMAGARWPSDTSDMRASQSQ
jgi:hypothetical protein